MTSVIRRTAVMLAMALLACGGDGRTVLTVYSPHGADLLQYYEREFEAAQPGIDVQWVDMGSQEVLDRLRAERANPQADVWFGAPAEIFDRGAREALLEPYRPAWADSVPPEARGALDAWFGTYLTPEVIAFNSDALTREEAPRDWDDVLHPRWRDQVLIRDPIASGTMRAIFGAMIARSVELTGTTDAGFDWLLRLDANTKEYVLNPTTLYLKMARGEGLVTLWAMPDIATVRQRTGMPIDYVIPASGTPVLVDGIGIVRNARQPNAARLYYEFVTTPEALLVAADSFFRIPARTDIPTDSLPEWIREAMAEIRPMAVDQTLLAERLDEWMRHWDANIRNRGR